MGRTDHEDSGDLPKNGSGCRGLNSRSNRRNSIGCSCPGKRGGRKSSHLCQCSSRGGSDTSRESDSRHQRRLVRRQYLVFQTHNPNSLADRHNREGSRHNEMESRSNFFHEGASDLIARNTLGDLSGIPTGQGSKNSFH